MKKWIAAVLAVGLAAMLLGGCLGEGGVKPAPSESLAVGGADDSASAQGAESSQEAASAQSAATFTLVVPEGFTLPKIGMRLEELGIGTAQEFVDAAQSGNFSHFPLIAALPENAQRCFTLEGYLFPATYTFNAGATPDEIIGTLLTTAESRFAQVSAEVAASGYSLNDIIILASIIEKEAKGEESMGMISSVFHNRLDAGMPLQSDPTISYVENVIKPFITGDENRYNEYYNTYKCPALPAGPISNPGMAAIRAALSPEASDYLYFLTDENDVFYYAATFEEHQANIVEAGL